MENSPTPMIADSRAGSDGPVGEEVERDDGFGRAELDDEEGNESHDRHDGERRSGGRARAPFSSPA